MIAPQPVYKNDPILEVLLAVREFLDRNPCAVHFDTEAISSLLYKDRYLPHPAAAHEVEAALEALAVEGEVLA